MRSRPNILLITADDMNWDAVGAYGCPVPGTTPNIDRLAADGMRFEHAHVTIAVCQPSRSVLMTGRYPHNSGGEGFFHLRKPGMPILPGLLRSADYLVGILGKVAHSTPYAEFEWDMHVDMDQLGMGRNPAVYRQYVEEFVKRSVEANRPFFLMVNSHDPHRPFYGNDREEWYTIADPPAMRPSRTFTAGDIVTPGHLEDLPDVRLEIAEYYSSVRRCDDTVGDVLDVVAQAGDDENTIVLFLSDNGMAFPFAKTNCYLNSTRTPWIVRWPALIKPGAHDDDHLVSGIDLLPTLLEAAGIDTPDGVDGRSFLPVCRGEQQEGRDRVFTEFHQTAGRGNYPMRCVQTTELGYIFNPWSDGERIFRNESQSRRTFKAMAEEAEIDAAVAARVQMFLYRVPEELYDFSTDAHARVNLIDDPAYAGQLNSLRDCLDTHLDATNDPALRAFRNRDDPGRVRELLTDMSSRFGGR
jgi:N-sulfoglucosamine sulfohydrolase